MSGPRGVIRFGARVVIVAIACAVATSWFGWLSVPFVGFIYGVMPSRARGSGSIAALGAVLAWAGLLGAEMARGANILLVASRIGALMQVPPAVLIGATLVFGAILAGTASVLGTGVGAVVFGSRAFGSTNNNHKSPP